MRIILFVVGVLLLGKNITAQTRQSSIKLYNVNIKARDVLGTKHDIWGPAGGDGITTPLNPPKLTNYRYALLGNWYSTKNFYAPRTFLNAEVDVYSPVLDSINFIFYRKYGFRKLENKNPSLLKDTTYISLKKRFTDSKIGNESRREILYSFENRQYLNLLEDSRFNTDLDVIMTNTVLFSNDLKIGLGAEIAANVKQNFNLDASVEARLKDSVVKSIDMTEAHYYEISLDDNYITNAMRIVKNCSQSLNSMSDDEDFIVELKNLKIDPDNCAVITKVACIEATFSVNKNKDINATIGAVIKGNIDPSKQKDISKLTADITAKYIGGKNTNGTIKASSFYNLRYAYSNGF